MANNCVIVFDQNEHGTYFTGQTVTGKVIVTLSKARKLKGIKLEICGYALAQWKMKHGKRIDDAKVKPGRKHVYYGREDYIASTTFLVGSNEGNSMQIEPGIYTYKFACPIPPNCPSSYEGSYGHIRYVAKVTFVRSGSTNRTHTVGFTVLKLLDLNKESKLLLEPASNEALENFCFFGSTAVHLNVDLMQTGYVPGQMILVCAKVNNESQVDCKKLLIALNLRATYVSDTPSIRSTSETICLIKKYCGAVPRNLKRTFTETIRVPATPPTCEHLSKVVKVSYEICVVAVMNHFMYNPKTIIPITIGNIPLTNAVNVLNVDDIPTTSSCAMQIAEGRSHEMLNGNIDIATEDDDDEEEEGEMELPPPTYEEAMFMSTEIVNNDADTEADAVRFTPRYPVYDVDNMLVANATNQTPAPNAPVKRRRKKKKSPQPPQEMQKEKPPIESPIEI
ncbi:arrestin domain-containing protein 17-like [Teleopsis dalmanni]|uniref:arrestin domain-containing protein 17-like n=1 Tax=Teleopsis dalmanni TaxID=139649 RepID=UPI0018CEF273|nr:arrestin domain-containing protein 17-like [Teleopsis dalmanni]